MPKTMQYTVAGFWPFPLDMLRRDQSSAASEADLEMIHRLSGDHAPDKAAFETVEIRLEMAGSWFSGQHPCTARWKSFGWRVVDDPFAPIEAEQRHNEALRTQGLAKLTAEERKALGWPT